MKYNSRGESMKTVVGLEEDRRLQWKTLADVLEY